MVSGAVTRLVLRFAVPVSSRGGKAAGKRRIRWGNMGVKRPLPHGSSGSFAIACVSTPAMRVETS